MLAYRWRFDARRRWRMMLAIPSEPAATLARRVRVWTAWRFMQTVAALDAMLIRVALYLRGAPIAGAAPDAPVPTPADARRTRAERAYLRALPAPETRARAKGKRR